MESEWFGKTIKDEIDRREMTQKELSQKSGIDQYHLNKILHGKIFPTWYTMSQILNALHMDLQLVYKANPDPDEMNDIQGNNGPLRAIKPEDVLMRLNDLATGGFLAEEWRDVIMDAFTLIWMRYE